MRGSVRFEYVRVFHSLCVVCLIVLILRVYVSGRRDDGGGGEGERRRLPENKH